MSHEQKRRAEQDPRGRLRQGGGPRKIHGRPV